MGYTITRRFTREPFPDYRLLPFTDDHVDGFAGGGGASEGYYLATGRHPTAALNHSLPALRMHQANHGATRHFCEDIRIVHPHDVCRGRRPGSAHFSPDCRDFSKAKGGKPKSKRVRGLAWTVVHWVNVVSPGLITLENVEEFQTWAPLLAEGRRNPWRAGWFFTCFVGALRRRGYVVEWREIRACDYGTPTIRKRLVLIAKHRDLVARTGGIVWPDESHSSTAFARALQPRRCAADCLDLSLPCPSIFLTNAQARKLGVKRPLAAASLQRIADGIDRHVLRDADPFIVVTNTTGHAATSPARPLGTVATGGHHMLVAPVLAYGQHGGSSRSVRQPAHTIAASAKDTNQVVALSLATFNTGSTGASARRPFPTIPAVSFHKRPGGNPPLDVSAVYLAQNNTGMVGHDVREPVSTISGKGAQQSVVAVDLVKYFGTLQDQRATAPLHSVTTKDRFGAVAAEGVTAPLTPAQRTGARRVAKFLRDHGVAFEGKFATLRGFVIVDIGLRMLTARELFRAQGFRDSYVIGDDPSQGLKLTKTQQVHMCGNSVCPPMMAAIYHANLPDLALPLAA